VKSLRIDCVLC